MFAFLRLLAIIAHVNLNLGVNAVNCNQWERSYNDSWVTESADIQTNDGIWHHVKDAEVSDGTDTYLALEMFCRNEPVVKCDDGNNNFRCYPQNNGDDPTNQAATT